MRFIATALLALTLSGCGGGPLECPPGQVVDSEEQVMPITGIDPATGTLTVKIQVRTRYFCRDAR